MDDEGGDGGEEKWRNQRKWLTRTRTTSSVNSKRLHRGQTGGWLTAGKDKDWISQFDNGEMAQIAHVDAMADNAN